MVKTAIIGVMLTAVMAAEAKPVKRLNGLCNGIQLHCSSDPFKTKDEARMKLFKALELPGTRFHDQVYENGGMPILDVSQVFPLFHADENDPRNYRFGPSDAYLERVREYCGELELRLGEQIEHTKKKYLICPPDDVEKWARICINIIRHYNDGWADGYKWNIRRFSVWEEPDNVDLMHDAFRKDANGKWIDGTFREKYLPMYKAVSKAIKERWPEAEVGGPNSMGPGDAFKTFLDYCAKEKLPLDFAAFTTYPRTPEEMMKLVRTARAKLDAAGFTKTRLSISEWHIPPLSWTKSAIELPDMVGIGSAAFSAGALILGQDEPVDTMYYYAAYVSSYGMFDVFSWRPRPVYYVYRDFAKLAHGERLDYPLLPEKNVYTLAVKFADGSGAMQVAGFKREEQEIRIKVPAGFRPTSVLRVAERGESVEDKDWTVEGDSIVFRNSADSSIRYVTLAARSWTGS